MQILNNKNNNSISDLWHSNDKDVSEIILNNEVNTICYRFNCVPLKNSHAEVLTTITSECDLIWK